jgi:hypothetical protein
MEGVNLFSSKTKGSSQFWQGLHKVKHLFKRGATFEIGDGNHCLSWQDCWLYDVLLKIYHEELYKMARHLICYVSDCWVEQDLFVDFRRALSSEEFQRWTLIYDELQHISLDEANSDKVIWALEKSKYFLTKSLYRFLTSRGMPSKVAGFYLEVQSTTQKKFLFVADL